MRHQFIDIYRTVDAASELIRIAINSLYLQDGGSTAHQM